METADGQTQPKCRTKFDKAGDEEKDDRISALPDCVLFEILSRLPSTKGAIRTGTLSKRWEHLWTLVPTLVFKNYDHYLSGSDFVSFVDKTLTQCRQLNLKKFEVYTSYYTGCVGFELKVNDWIRYALSRNAEELNLRLSGVDTKFLLGQFIFVNTCFTDLTLSGCILNPIGAISWKNLRRLCITYGKLDEVLIENILSGTSPVLETLVLDHCYGYRRLNITSKSVKNLVFSGYNIPEDEDDFFASIIEINAPNILSLTIEDELVLLKLLLVNMSSLVKVDLDYLDFWDYATLKDQEEGEEEMLKGLLLDLCHVKELKIWGLCSEVMSRLEAKGFVSPWFQK